MSKSTGNFITLSQAIQKFGADATRIALADAGDTMDDANFVEDNANAAILRLYTQKEWMEEVMKGIEEGKFRDGEYNFNDHVFENEMNKFILAADSAYSNMYYRDALKYSFFELQSSRDRYRDACAEDKMHKDLLIRFIEVQALLLEPIATHFAEYIWRVLLKKEGSITTAKFPEITKPVDEGVLHASSYIRDLIRDIRVEEQNAQKKKKKGPAVNLTSKNAKLFVALKYPDWQEESVAILKECWDEESKSFVKNEKEALAKKGLLKNKKVMPFVAALKKNVINNGSHAFDRRLDFEEMEFLEENKKLILRSLNLETLNIVNNHEVTEENSTPEEVRKASMAIPGKPMFIRV
jgi:leucyl-tRNA synthetase